MIVATRPSDGREKEGERSITAAVVPTFFRAERFHPTGGEEGEVKRCPRKMHCRKVQCPGTHCWNTAAAAAAAKVRGRAL